MAARLDTRKADQPDLAPILAGLARRHGASVLEQRARLHGLLRDYAPTAVREIRVLLLALDAGTPARIAAAPDPEAASLLSAEADRVAEAFGCAQPLALAAAETWARTFSALRRPESGPLPVAHHAGFRAAAAGAAASTGEEDRQSWFGRWGGGLIAALLVLVALARWLGML